ncbi:XRE family transcriptional regulator [Agrobacterium albertimagni AOL15]|uniref:XRE family transcriptional regulator n=1 Tax=Agrobacterium albertimagni AOL15 TaxID=1156935 RepID=K2QFP0_9HYPH|nr:XRE family transcriptional regulator [Agrobacterium albertimagni AOL15]
MSNIEKGSPSPEIGIVFEVASIVGVRLFDYDERNTLKERITQLDEKLTLLPKSVRHSVEDIDDAF